MQGNVILCALAKIQNRTFSSLTILSIMNNSKEEKILGVTIGNKMTFSSHIRVSHHIII